MSVVEHHSSLEQLLASLPPGRQSLIPILQEIQELDGYLSVDRVTELARLIGVSDNEIYGVATFYTRFRFSPPARHTIHVCLGTACHVRGGHRVLREFERELGVDAGESTADQAFGLERVFCVGCCALAPVSVVDNTVHAGMVPKKVRPLLDSYRNGDAGDDAGNGSAGGPSADQDGSA
jgi:NADH-quinone oxidoreductase subunit E